MERADNGLEKKDPPLVLQKELEQIQLQKSGEAEECWSDNWTNGPDHHESD